MNGEYLGISMKQSPPPEANSRSANQTITRILWNPKAHYRVHKSQPPDPTLARWIQSTPSNSISQRSIFRCSSRSSVSKEHFFYCCEGEAVSLPPAMGPLSFSQILEQRRNDIRGKPKNSWEKPVSVPLCPSQITNGLIWAWTPASSLRSRWLTAWEHRTGPSQPVCRVFLGTRQPAWPVFSWNTVATMGTESLLNQTVATI
jgi:hypothetical protein